MPPAATPKRIGILVVHGVGEQKTFEHLEEIAGNLYLALNKDKDRQAHIQVRLGREIPHHAEWESWQEAPIVLSWRKIGTLQEEWIEVSFREVYWADLDMRETWKGWLDFVLWALAMSGARLYWVASVLPSDVGLRLPQLLTFSERQGVRIKLFGLSFVFLLMLMTVNLLNYIAERLSINIPTLKKLNSTFFNFVGDVKLYQDGFRRTDNTLGAIGDKSRVGIRRRMVRALVQSAIEVGKGGKRGGLDEYYIFAHSLGTVLAFNALMELAGILPRYLTEDEWKRLEEECAKQPEKCLIAHQGSLDPSADLRPQLPYWVQPSAQIDRTKLFSGLKGFLTMGSPLDKFAALWPRIVTINTQRIAGNVPWINVADKQDIVAGKLDLFQCPPSSKDVEGLQLTNIHWAGQLTPFTAHTSYWKVEEKSNNRLIDRIILWLEGNPIGEGDLEDRYRPWLGIWLFWFWMLLAGAVLLLLLGSGPWVLGHVPQLFNSFMDGNFWKVACEIFASEGYLHSLQYWVPRFVLYGVGVIMVCSVVWRLWEEWMRGEWERKNKEKVSEALKEEQ